MWPSARLLMSALALSVWAAPTSSAQEPTSRTFDFGEGAPFHGVVSLGDMTVQLITTNTEPWGATSFRDQLTGIPAEITFCFSRPIDEFRIEFSRILNGEKLRSFTAGPPAQIEGDLIDQGDLSFTVPPEVGDFGTGTLIWRQLNTQFFSFVIDNPPGAALAVDTFALSVQGSENNSLSESSEDFALETKPCEQMSGQVSVVSGSDEKVVEAETTTSSIENGTDTSTNEDLAEETSKQPEVRPEKEAYSIGESIGIFFENAQVNQSAWVGIAAEGSPDTNYVQWQYIPNVETGSIELPGLSAAGAYEARLYRDGGYVVIARQSFTVGGGAEPAQADVATGDSAGQTQTVVTSAAVEPVVSWQELSKQISPEPTSLGPLTGSWQADVSCSWADEPATLTVDLIHFSDMSIRSVVTFSATGQDGVEIVGRYHAYGKVNEFWGSHGTQDEVNAGTAEWIPLYGIELTTGPWIEQPAKFTYGANIRADQDLRSGTDLEGVAQSFDGCDQYVTFRQVDASRPVLDEPPEEVVKKLDQLRYPAKASDQYWYVPAAQIYPEFAGSLFGMAADNVARCHVLDDWTRQLFAEYPNIPYGGVSSVSEENLVVGAKLFADPTFKPVFGVSIDAMSKDASRFVKDSLRYCGLALPKSRAWIPRLIEAGIFSDQAEEYAVVRSEAVAHRDALTWAQQAVTQLEALPTEASDYVTMLQIAKDAEARLAPLWPSEKQDFELAMETTQQRLAEPVLLAQLTEVLSAAQGMTGATALRDFASGHEALLSRVPDDVAQSTLQEVDDELANILEVESAAAFDELENRGEGVAAITAGNAWYANYAEQFSSFLDNPVVQKRLRDFLDLRASDLASAHEELTREVKSLQTISDVLNFQDTRLLVPGDWENEDGIVLAAVVRDRKSEIYDALERSGEYLPLTDYSPFEESLMNEYGTIQVPDEYRPPKGHEILLAIIRGIDAYSGEQVSSNAVRYQLPSTKQIIATIPGISTEMLNLVQDISLPVYAIISFRYADVKSCRLGDTGGYVCSYVLDTYLDSDAYSGGGLSGLLEDHFVLGPQGWSTSTFNSRLSASAIESWGVISEGVVQGLKSAACMGALPDDPDCY